MTAFLAALIVAIFAHPSDAVQPAFDVKELAAYRLTAAVFKQFEEASRLIADVTESDATFASAPLFTKEITLSGDAAAMAVALEMRLQNHPSLAHALQTAKITAHEYATFTLALVAARLAHGFVNAGVLRVPAGVAADNVTFVEQHHVEIVAVLKKLRIES